MFRLQAVSEDDTIYSVKNDCASSDVSKAVPVGAGAVLFLVLF